MAPAATAAGRAASRRARARPTPQAKATSASNPPSQKAATGVLDRDGVIRNSDDGQIPSASSGLRAWRRLPKPVLPPSPEGLKASKLAKCARLTTSGREATTVIAT